MTGLTPWAASSGIRTAFIATPTTNDRQQMIQSLVEPVEVTLHEPTPMTLSLHWHAAANGPDTDLHSRIYRVEEQVVLRIETPTPQPWNAFGPTAVAVRDLMTVATQIPCRVTERTLLINSDEPPGPYTVDLYYRGSSYSAEREDKFRKSEMVFTLRDIDFATVIQRWFPLRDKLGLPLDVLLGLDYQTGGYYENRLFNTASAAEGFHAALCPDTTAVPTDVHSALKKRVSGALAGLKKGLLKKVTALISELHAHEQKKILDLLTGLDNNDQREWVMTSLGDNRPGLKARYLELATKADSEAVAALLTDVDIWAQWLRDARNAIGHLNTGELAEKVPDEDARYRLVYITRALLHLIVLSELGISADTQRGLVNDEWNYSAEQFRDAVRDHRNRQSYSLLDRSTFRGQSKRDASRTLFPTRVCRQACVLDLRPQITR